MQPQPPGGEAGVGVLLAELLAGAGAAAARPQPDPGTLPAQERSQHLQRPQLDEQRHHSHLLRFSSASASCCVSARRACAWPWARQHQRSGQAQRITIATWGILWASSMLGWMLGYANAATWLLPHSSFWRRLFYDYSDPSLAFMSTPLHSLNGVPLAPAGDASSLLLTMQWCADQTSGSLTLFIASRFLVAALSFFPAAWVVHRFGRKRGMACACLLYILASVVLITTYTLAQLVVANLLVGVAIAFLYQAIILSMVECSPTRHRGALTSATILASLLGFVCGVAVFWSASIRLSELGWRLGSASGMWPAVVVLLILPWLPETPDYLIQRGELSRGRDALLLVRGERRPEQLDAELNQLYLAGKPAGGAGAGASSEQGALRVAGLRQQARLLRRPHYLIPLAVCCWLALLRETVGSHVLAPLLPALLVGVFKADDGRLESLWKGGLLLESFYSVGALAAVLLIDRVGRRPLLLVGAAACTLTWTALSALLAHFKSTVAVRQAGLVWPFLVLILATAIAHGASWYSVVFTVIAESHALAVRPLAVAIAACCMMAARGALHVGTETLLCDLQWRMLLVIAAVFCLLMVFTASLMVPEAARVPLDRMQQVWASHWLWGRWVGPSMAAERERAAAPHHDSQRPSGPSGGRAGNSLAGSERGAARSQEPRVQSVRQQHLWGGVPDLRASASQFAWQAAPTLGGAH